MKKIRTLTVLFLVLKTAALFCQTASGNPAQEDDKFKKAVTYFYQQKMEMAEVLLQESIKANPENWEAYSYLGDVLLIKKKYDEALGMYLKALNLNPSSAENYFRTGQIYYYKKFGVQSVDNFKKALELAPGLKFAHYHIGLSSLMLLRNKEATISSWEKFLQAAPDDPQYENIRKVIELLKDPSFKIPPPGSEISIEEALLLGGSALEKIDRQASDRQAGHESKKTRNVLEEIYLDDDL